MDNDRYTCEHLVLLKGMDNFSSFSALRLLNVTYTHLNRKTEKLEDNRNAPPGFSCLKH